MPPSAGRQQLLRLRELLVRVGEVNQPKRKKQILQEYPDLRGILERLMDDRYRIHLSTKGLRKHLNSFSGSQRTLQPKSARAITLESFLDSLQRRDVSGKQAQEFAERFARAAELDIERMKGLQEAPLDQLTIEDVFERVLDRNLKSGFSARTLRAVEWPSVSLQEASTTWPTQPVEQEAKASPSAPAQPQVTVTESLDQWLSPLLCDEPVPQFSCALGKTVTRHELSRLFISSPEVWYSSRKLDGVRVFALVDVYVPNGPPDDQIEVLAVQTVSRRGKPFFALDKLKTDIAKAVTGWSKVRKLVGGDEASVVHRTVDGSVYRLVLDGECCQLVDTGSSLDGRFKEDFKSMVSAVRRRDWNVERPVLFLLDVLSWGEFQGKSSNGKTFGERLSDVQAYAARAKEVVGDDCRVRSLDQRVVTCAADIEAMIGEAAEHGWEGLVIRKDVLYEGKRSSNVRKYKEWQDSEYVATGIETGPIRLSVNGIFQEREACTNILFEHKGELNIAKASASSLPFPVRHAGQRGIRSDD